MTDGIPWLYANPSGALAEWKVKFDAYDARLQKEIEAIKYDLRDHQLSDSGKKRTDRYLRAKIEHQKSVRKLMGPLDTKYSDNPSIHDAVKSKMPITQKLSSYSPNVFRDWVWGDEENKASLDLVSEVIGDSKLGQSAVLGPGACRLAYDIYETHTPDCMLLLEINPYLLFAAKTLISGKSCSLQEFPMAPLNAEDVAVEHKIKGLKPSNDKLFFAFADALNPPVKKGSLDTIITPWFVDIVPMDLKDQMKLYNSLTKMGGSWVNFGTLAYTHADIKKRYSRDEWMEILPEYGWEVVSKVEREIPYLNSPYSGNRRTENVLTFRAQKVKEVAYEKVTYNFLPDWILRDEVALPNIPLIQNLILINFVFAELLTLVTQGATIESLGQAVAPKLNLPVDQSKEILRNLLTRVYEENMHQLYQ